MRLFLRGDGMKRFFIGLFLIHPLLVQGLGLDSAQRELISYAQRMKDLDAELASAEKMVAAQRAALDQYVAQKNSAAAQLTEARQKVDQFVTSVKTLGPGIEKIAEAERKVKSLDAQINQLTAQFNAGRAKPLADLKVAQNNVATIRSRIDAKKALINRLKREIDTEPNIGKKIEYGIVKGSQIAGLGIEIGAEELAYHTAMGVLRASEELVRKAPAELDPRVGGLKAQREIALGVLNLGRNLITGIGNQGALVLVSAAQPVFVTFDSLARLFAAVDTLITGARTKLDALAQELAAARILVPQILEQNGIAQKKVEELQRFIADLQGVL